MRWLGFSIALVMLLGALPLACRDKSGPPSEGGTYSTANATARGQEARSKPYVASVGRHPFHKSTCEWAKKIHTRNLAGYDTRNQAIKDGHRPCQVCNP